MKKNTGNKIGIILSFLGFVIFRIIGETIPKTGAVNGNSAIYLAGILLLFTVYFVIRSSKVKKHNKQLQFQAQTSGDIPLVTAHLSHIYGINDLPENDPVTLSLYNDRLDIKAKNETFKLPLSRLRNLDRKIDTDITEQYVSSIGGAALGGFLAGPLGMAFGGRAKKKKSVDRKFYIVLGYDTSEGKKIVLFNDQGLSGNKLIKKVNELVTIEHRTTEL